MGASTLRSGLMTAVSAWAPTANYDYQTKSALRLGSPGDTFGYLYFAAPFPLTATITSAKLHLWTEAYTQTGTHSITATRLAQRVSFARVTYQTRPTQLHGTGPSISKSGAQGAASEWVFDVTAQMQAVSNGDPWFGWRLNADFNPAVYVYGPTYPNTAVRPWLEVTWADNPATPVGLSPSGGRAVSLSNPVLRAQYHDVSGDTDLAAVQVQFAATSTGFGAPSWDSGSVPSTDPELDTNTDGANFLTVRTTSGSTTITAATGAFTAADVGKSVVGLGIPAGATIVSQTGTAAVISAAATATLGIELAGTDASFEAGVNSFTAVGGSTLTSSTVRAHTGTHSLAVVSGTASSSSDATRSFTPVTGATYTFGVWIFVPATNTSLTGHLGVSGAGATTVNMGEVTAGSWQQQTLRYTALSTAGMNFNLIGSGTIGETVNFDDVSLVADPSAITVNRYPGLADAASTWWRIREQDGAGLWSAWSDPATFKRDIKGTLTLLNPPDPVGTGYFQQTYPAAQTANSTTGINYSSSGTTDPTMTANPGDVVEAGVWMRSTLTKDLAPLVQGCQRGRACRDGAGAYPRLPVGRGRQSVVESR
jgi:hypothetical protein